MTKIAPIEEIASKWSRVTPLRAPDFEAGVRNPGVDWAQATAAAEGNYDAGVQAAIADKRFGKGVKKAGTSKWQTATLTKGISRWTQGVADGGAAYAAGFAPFQSAIAALTLPQRFARRDPRNLERVKAVVNAMIKTAQAQGS